MGVDNSWKMICVLLPAFLSGCHADPNAGQQTTAQQSAQQQLEAQLKVDEAARLIAMDPMKGVWKSDLPATLAEDTTVSEQMRVSIREDLDSYPIELRITDRDYVSHTRMKTMHDQYVVQFVDGSGVHLQLTGAVADQPVRHIVLRVHEGHLVVDSGTPFHFAFSRVADSATRKSVSK